MPASAPRVLLVSPASSCDGAAAGPRVKPELVSLWSELRRRGCGVEVLDLEVEADAHAGVDQWEGDRRDAELAGERDGRLIGKRDADLVVVVCLDALRFGAALAAARLARESHSRAVVAVVGHHPTVRPADFTGGAAEGLFDWVIRGEPEISLAAIAAEAVVSGREPKVCRVGEGEPLPLEAASLPDYANYPYVQPGLPALGVYLSRGCQYHSAICYAGPGGGVWRAYPPDAAFELLAGLDVLQPAEIEVLDPTFGLDSGWRRVVLDRLAALERRHVPLSLTARPDEFARADIDAVYGGRLHVHFNIGTLSPTLLGALEVLQPQRRLERVLDLLRYANAKGVPAEIDVVFGQPGETRRSAGETLDRLAALIDSFPNTSFRLAATSWAYFPASSPEVDVEGPAQRFGTRIESPEWWKESPPSLLAAQAVVPSGELADLPPGDDSYWRPRLAEIGESFATKLTAEARRGLRSHESVGSAAADVPHGYYREPRWH